MGKGMYMCDNMVHTVGVIIKFPFRFCYRLSPFTTGPFYRAA